ncbi:TfoX/Sxy family protein [Naumannella halotolerans]|uniref:TfoX-like protein n=1 Tax=Naumannella halotolerans TaxID=993414 RepID=A0A4R7J8B4_9ACTN|nr:TfoX/Sxy family protein [Naumannella halotolerans]TDT33535.1 TfoX-like protein [Naumannella halotolerans]
MAADAELTERVRAALAEQPTVREVRMFGGLSFMVNEKLVVCVRSDAMLVRVAAADHESHLAEPGVAQPEMGAGRSMGPGWIEVDTTTLTDDASLAHWLEVGLAHNATLTG